MSPGAMLFGMLLGHAVADFPLQSEFIAVHKSPRNSVPSAPWVYVMAAHAATHAAAVWIVSGSALLAALEMASHFIIDLMKCEGMTDISRDQALHVMCKVAWVIMAVGGVR